MPFTKENAAALRGPGGRKPKDHPDVVKRKAIAEIAREYLQLHAEPVLGTYFKLASNGQDSATTRHYIDKILPDDNDPDHGQTIIVNIATGTIQQRRTESDVRTDSLQIRVGGNNGQNGNGSDGS